MASRGRAYTEPYYAEPLPLPLRWRCTCKTFLHGVQRALHAPARGPRPATGSPSDMLAGSLTSRPAWPTALSIGLSDTALITILERSINHDARDTSYLPAALPTFTAHSHRHT